MARSEEVRFRAGDDELVGTLRLPDVTGRAPWALLLPSWLPRDRDGAWDRLGHPTWFAADDGGRPGLLARLADLLADAGVASFRYDKRGCAASGGSWTEASLFTLIDDARDAIGAMRSRSELDLRRTGILGHGEGATIALSVSIGDPAISAVTFIGAAARSLRDVWRRGAAVRARTGIDHEHPIVAELDRWCEELLERAERREARMVLTVAHERVVLDLASWEQAIHTPARALATMLHRSVALVHGAHDAWTDPDESLLLAATPGWLAGDGARVEIIADAGHDLAEASETAIAAVAADLARRIVPRTLPPVLLAIEDADAG